MTVTLYTFDRVARAERYFANTLLPHLLMAHEFSGLKLLFQHVFPGVDFTQAIDDFEIVTELDPLRDGSVGNMAVRTLYRDRGRVAVPDLFVRWDHYCLVVEAKFFTDPADDDLTEQVRLQREAITAIRDHTLYQDQSYQIEHLILCIRKSCISNAYNLTWEELCDPILAPVLASSDCDMQYCRRVIEDAITRANREALGKISFTKLSFAELMRNLSTLIEQQKVYIGFTGGEDRLAQASLDELEHRSHYKVSDKRWSDNWISLDQFLHRVFTLKGYCE
ncbi:MAG: hypothetical protein BWY76_00625 [bacterium ADurb.Bin429]|nr:MAG: hypothetical protein BWY76_00625 [bacterium ADurb.Bin429]